MKTLLIVRHAKSSWNDHTLSDFDRPLNDRGQKDAPEMAERLVKRKVPIDMFVSSPAKRAKKTALAFTKAYGRDKDEIVFVESLYHATENEFFNVISQLPETANSAAVFSHNPGITDFVNRLTDIRVDNVPTCGVFAVTFDGQWQSFKQTPKQFLFFDYPKNATD